MKNKYHVYIGYDERRPMEYEVCLKSFKDNSSGFVTFSKLDLTTLKRRGLYTRTFVQSTKSWSLAFTDRRSTEILDSFYDYAKFLTPHIATMEHKEGLCLFMDSTVLCRQGCDILDLFLKCEGEREDTFVWAVKDYYPESGSISMIMYDLNNPAVFLLTPERISLTTLSVLTNFNWAGKRSMNSPGNSLGCIPREWCLDLYTRNINKKDLLKVKAVNFSKGSPIRKRTKRVLETYDDTFEGEWWDGYYYYITEELVPELESK